MKSNPDILLLGDYSNFHRTLATGLRRRGCRVTIASDGTRWMDTERDVDISRADNKFGGMRLWWRLTHGDLAHHLRGHDVVAIHDLNFVRLRPERLRPLLDSLKRHNGAVYLSAISTDIAYLDMLEATDSPLRYSEWFVDGAPSRYHRDEEQQWRQWHADALVSYQRHALDTIDGAVSGLYEYHLGMERALGADRVAYGGIPVDTTLYEPVALPDTIDCVRLFLGRDRTRMAAKGSDLLEYAAREAIARHPGRAELVIVENRPFAEFTELLRSAHVVLDQIYSYTPATTALMAMSYGLNVVSGAEEEYYDFIGETSNRPIYNAPTDAEALTQQIEDIITHPERIAARGRASREFAVKHNDVNVVADRFMRAWGI
ncbi:MAG: hypothetical protein K2M55_04315 [Muribaculaceae bacterium]|nr:hypothetical protein [Muribaculaceae bacterium]